MKEQKFHIGIKALLMNENNEMLILKADPSRFVNRSEHWDIPGGRIIEGYSVEETLRKEVEEELGITDIEIIRQFDALISNFKIPLENENLGLALFVYLCRTKERSFRLSPEHTEYKWVTVKEAKELLKVKYPEAFIDKLDTLKK